MHEELYLAVSHIYGSRFRCLNMVKMSGVNNSDLKDTDLASLIISTILFYKTSLSIGLMKKHVYKLILHKTTLSHNFKIGIWDAAKVFFYFVF